MTSRLVVVPRLVVAAAVALAAGCTCPSPPPAPRDAGVDRGPPLRPPPPPEPAVDAAVDAPDASDASGAGAGGRKRAAAPAETGGGGMAGLTVTGGLGKADAAKVVKSKAGALRACYERERARNPALRGRVSFQLTVDGRGRVTLGEIVSSTLGSGETEMCMVDATRGFKFPMPADGGESTVRFQMGFGK